MRPFFRGTASPEPDPAVPVPTDPVEVEHPSAPGGPPASKAPVEVASRPRESDVDFAERADEVGDLLRPLTYAEGHGLPWEDLWARLASRLSGHLYTDADIARLLDAPPLDAIEIVEANEDGRTVYGLRRKNPAESAGHDPIGDDGPDPAAVHTAFVRTLVERVPRAADGSRDWARAHPYSLRHLATHARLAGLLEEIVLDPEYLVHADPLELMPHLHTVRAEQARTSVIVYRASIGTHREVDAATRRRILALHAVCHGAKALATALNERMEPRTWKPAATSGGTVTPAARDTFGRDEVQAVGCTTLEGRPVAVACFDDDLAVWDLATGSPLGDSPTPRWTSEYALACTTLDGRPVAVAAADDNALQVWDVATRTRLGEPLTGHEDFVSAVACTTLEGRVVAVSASDDCTVRIWDLAASRPLGPPLTGHTDEVHAVTCTVLNGRPTAVSASKDGTVRVWDLPTGRPVGEPLPGITEPNAVTCTTLEGRPVVVMASDHEPGWGQLNPVRAWDLVTRRPVGEPLSDIGMMTTAACTMINERPVVVAASYSRTAHVWDLATGRLVGPPLSGHTDTVNSVACTSLDGRPIAVTASNDRTLRLWELTGDNVPRTVRPNDWHHVSAIACSVVEGRLVALSACWGTVAIWDTTTGRRLSEGPDGVYALACTTLRGRPVAVTTSFDATVRMWDLAGGRRVGEPLTGHEDAVSAVACTTLAGGPVAVTGSHDHTVRVWDLTAETPVGTILAGHTGKVCALTCTTLDGRPVAVSAAEDHTVRIWNLTTGQQLGVPLHCDAKTVRAMACAVVDGRPVVVTAAAQDNTVRVWDLATGDPVGAPLAGHTAWVQTVTCAVVDGRPVAVTGSDDNTARIWDLTEHTCTDVIHLPGQSRAVAMHPDGGLVCGFGNDIAIFRRT